VRAFCKFLDRSIRKLQNSAISNVRHWGGPGGVTDRRN
jgi:hypothetical protein